MEPIKLIACDLDGTLLLPGQTGIAPAVFEQIRRLREKGILFCPASGRQYNSLRQLFAPVADELPYICENGAVVFDDAGKVISKSVVEREIAMRLVKQILSHEDCRVLISGENTSYLVTDDAVYIRYIQEGLGNRIVILNDPEEIPEDIIKVSLYCKEGVQQHHAEFERDWADIFSVAVAGFDWLDMTLANKGIGICALAERYGVELCDVMAIGDNYNDLPMLSVVGHPYIMEHADAPLLARIANKCHRVEETLALL